MIRGPLLALLLLGTATASAPETVVVSAAWLSQHLKDADVVTVHVGRKSEYAAAHLADSRLIDPEASAGLESSSMGSGESMDMSALPAIAEIHGKLEQLGISNTSRVVVVFDGPDVTSATRTIFLMKYAGVENVALLDGGIAAWKRASLPVTAVVPVVKPARFTATAATGLGVDHKWVQLHLNAPHVRIIDARDPVYYNGPTQGGMGMAPGHIPGAKNIQYSSLVDEAGLFLSPAAVEAKFRAAGVQPGDTVLAYCHVGIQATVVVLGARLIGQPVKMYVGSFHDWSARKLPTEGGKP